MTSLGRKRAGARVRTDTKPLFLTSSRNQRLSMIVAITGANGFIGQHLVRRFGERGWDGRPVVRADFDRDQVRKLFDGANTVVHAAGATRAVSIERLRDSNVGLTKRVVHAAKDSGTGRLIFLSSLAAMGPSVSRDQPVNEATVAAPIEPYGRTKLDAEAVVLNSGLAANILRPAAVYGPGDVDFFQLFRAANYGFAIHPANRSQWFSIIHVGDLVDAVVNVAETDEAVGRVYCLGNEAAVQWAELFPIAAKCAGTRLRFDFELPGWIVDAGARVGDLVGRIRGNASLLSTGKVALAKPNAWVCSSALARRELALGQETPIERGFCETYRWYRDHGWL
jgi:nucleoside-diphosphate-sugar epimerase